LNPPYPILMNTPPNSYLKVKELLPLTTLTRRGLLLRLKSLQTEYPSFIIGGSQGISYLVHHSKIPDVTKRRNKKNTPSFSSREYQVHQKRIVEQVKRIPWSIVGMINPAKDIPTEEILSLFPKHTFRHLFYTIHEDSISGHRHLHFCLDTDLSIRDLKTLLNKRKSFQTQLILPSLFEESLRDDCIRYFTTSRPEQRVVEFDLLEGVRDQGGLIRVSPFSYPHIRTLYDGG